MLEPKINNSEAYRLFHDGTLALSRSEQLGIRVDVAYYEKLKIELTAEIDKLDAQFKSTAFYRNWYKSIKNFSININSNAQLGKYLYKTLGIKPPKYTETGQGSTDEGALSALNIPELNVLLNIRKLRKIRDTYIESFLREQVNGVVHPSFNLHLVRTFRGSSDRPNFQNIPKRDAETMLMVRRGLFPRHGHQLLEVDCGKLEVKIAACYHKDPRMLKYLNDPGSDMHGDMAKQIFMIDDFNSKLPEYKTLRAAAKNGFVFPQFYGDYYKSCAASLACRWGNLPDGKWKLGQGVPLPGGDFLADHFIRAGMRSLDAFTEHVRVIEDDFWNRRFRAYNQWKQDWWESYLKKGYFDMLTGFRCSGVMGRNDVINYPVQGAAFHYLLKCLILIDDYFFHKGMKTRIIGQIHDALVLDVYPPELEKVVETLHFYMTVQLPELWKWIITPMEIEIDLGAVDASWADLKPYDIK